MFDMKIFIYFISKSTFNQPQKINHLLNIYMYLKIM